MVQLLKRDTVLLVLAAIVMTSCVSFSLTGPANPGNSQDQERAECRKVMMDIARAEESYKEQSPTHAYTTDIMDLQALNQYPVCPSGGQFSVTISEGRASDCTSDGRIVPYGGLIVRCNHKEHGVYAPDVEDH